MGRLRQGYGALRDYVHPLNRTMPWFHSAGRRRVEARVGFEPTNGGFADLSLGPLGYRAETTKYSESQSRLSVAVQIEKISNPSERLSLLRDIFTLLGCRKISLPAKSSLRGMSLSVRARA